MNNQEIRNAHIKVEQSKDMLNDVNAFHDIDVDVSLQVLVDNHNWPPDGNPGRAVMFIYHLILDSKIKVVKMGKEGDTYMVYFDEASGNLKYGDWIPHHLTLTPQPKGPREPWAT